MQDYTKLNQYLSNLAVLNVTFHNIHWNIVGKQFMRIHDFTEEIYDDFFEKYDEVAELLKMKNEKPLITLTDYLKNATVQEVNENEFSAKEALKVIEENLTEMKRLATEIRNDADEANDFEVVAEFEDHVADYSKNIWFVRAMMD